MLDPRPFLTQPPPRGWFERMLAGESLPFAGLVPAIVLISGIAAAIAITFIGVDQLKQQSDSAAALRSRLLAETLAERFSDAKELSEAKKLRRQELMERAAIRSDSELLLVSDQGEIFVDASLRLISQAGLVELLQLGEGHTNTTLGRSRFFAARVPDANPPQTVITFVPAPNRPFATESLVKLVTLFTLVFLGLAALVAFVLARDVHSDVAYVRERIVEMATIGKDPAGEPIPVRTVDQLGAITNGFNDLVERFTEAEQSYQQDLNAAVTIERDKSSFLAALSHELKTPLNVILGFADVLLAEVEGPLSEDARENMETVKRSGAHLKALIKDILDLSALESGELTLARVLSEVHTIADDVLKEHRVSATRKGLELSLTSKPTKAWADPVRVRQMIGNLVGNAIKFTNSGAIAVEVRPRGDLATITVTDTGPGIAPKEQAAIFDDYTQVGDVQARRSGSGLGLAITRRLVSMHDGQISLESELGKGARFTVVLPSVPKGSSLSRERIEPTPRPPEL